MKLKKFENELPPRFIEIVEAHDFSVEQHGENGYTFQRCSPADQDFTIEFCGNSVEDLWKYLLHLADDYDVSSQTILWLDAEGHGVNGAPHDMKDVYEDMEACLGYIDELAELAMLFGKGE